MAHNDNGAYLMTTKEVAIELGVPIRRLIDDRQNGRGIKFIRWGNRIYYRRATVLAFVQALETASDWDGV